MPSLIAEEMRRTYVAVRGVSQGAGITLVSRCDGYRATMACAQRCVLVLGDRNFNHDEIRPVFHIPNDEMARALGKLSETFSVALVDTVTDESGTRFVLIHKIPAGKPGEPATVPESEDNQGEMDLDEY